ncbi:hypothetical protein Tco_0572534 [Tanacetum coccineum]
MACLWRQHSSVLFIAAAANFNQGVQPPVVPVEKQNPVSEPDIAPVSGTMPNPKLSIPYPSRRNDERHHFEDTRFNYNDMKANSIRPDVELACERVFQEVLGFSDVIASGNPTPGYDPIVSNSSPTLTPFGDSDFLL